MDEKQKGQEDDTKALFRKCSGDADFSYFLCKILSDLNFAREQEEFAAPL